MLISTSRKPSQKTRQFCKNLSHVFGCNYVNRGKMNMRDLLLKALELDEVNLAVVNQIKGNPSRITFYSNKGEELLTILISVSVTSSRLNIQPSKLKLVSKVDELDVLSNIFDIELKPTATENYILISSLKDETNIAKITFFDKFGSKSDLQIYVKKIL